MNNLALAYTMDGQASQAEPMLRQATSTAADPRVRQNLALVLNLQGKKEEATRVAMGHDMPLPAAASTSIAARPAPAPARVAAVAPSPQPAVARQELPPPVRTAAVRTMAPSPVAPAATADPEDVIRAAVAAEVAHEQARSRNIATSSAPQR